MRFAFHLLLHAVVPGAVARVAWPERWRHAWLMMVLTMIVDVDHLLADPIIDQNRCSIGTHLLHTWPAIGVWLALCLPRKTRLVGVGLVIHMLLDGIDCLSMRGCID